ncbi:MAG TPA: DUF438 domain-containing protein [Oligoflexia bacterium]|nr:DUF438 domain-containing protein [Oligoflexia bacterium]
MSELLANAEKRKGLLKHMILQLHKGEAPNAVRAQLVQLLGKVPYEEVIEVEQELMAEGLPQEEVIKLCDLHSQVLGGQIVPGIQRKLPPGHPVETFLHENRALQREIEEVKKILAGCDSAPEPETGAREALLSLRSRFYNLLDVDKHYRRKEYLVFSHLERYGVSGPSTVMWGKDDEVRAKLRDAVSALEAVSEVTAAELASLGAFALNPALDGLEDMIMKEEEILFPMSLDKLSEADWYEISLESPEHGFCLYDPGVQWRPASMQAEPSRAGLEAGGKVKLATGSFTPEELTALLNTMPFDITFVDAEDRVRYFSQGRDRIFARNRAILGRNVRHCHPPGSVHIVEKIIDDFRGGRQDRAAFWIELQGRFIHIEYFALRAQDGRYLGVLEVSQDLTEKRKLEGERRLLSYD